MTSFNKTRHPNTAMNPSNLEEKSPETGIGEKLLGGFFIIRWDTSGTFHQRSFYYLKIKIMHRFYLIG